MRAAFSWALLAGLPIVFCKQDLRIHDVANQAAKDEPNGANVADTADAAQANNAAACCSNLARILPGKVFAEGLNSTRYDTQLASYWAKQEREVLPACFVLPSSAKDVSTIITSLSSINFNREDRGRGSGGYGGWRYGGWGRNRGGARSRGPSGMFGSGSGAGRSNAAGEPARCQFAIRSGGHTPIKGAANVQSGVTIDLSDMTQLEVAADGSYVSIGPGNRWQDVYSKLEPLGISTSGGRVATVGVGGLVTGGGISFFSRERGLVCDNVLEFEIVLSDGRIVSANSEENRDLYRALKGGSGNFGVVTRFDMKAFPFGKMWGGNLFHVDTPAARQQLFSYFESFTKSSTDEHAAWIHSWTFVNLGFLKQWFVVSNVEYTLPVENPAVFQPLLSPNITTAPTVGIDSLTNLTKGLAELNPSGSRQLFATLTHKNSAEFMEEFFQLGNQTAMAVQDVAGLKFSISYQSLSHSIYSKAQATNGNSVGLEEEDDDLIIVLLTATWDLPSNDTAMYEAARQLFTKAKAKSVEKEVDSSFLYLNYADKWQNPILGYGEDSVDRLRAVSARYDRRQLFQKAVPGGFKLPKAY